MSGFRRVICLYLAAALILGVVVTGFGAENIALFRVSENVNIQESTETENVASSEAASVIVPHTQSSVILPEREESTSAEATEAVTDISKEEALPQEEITADVNEEAPEDDLCAITFESILSASPVLHNSYSPDTVNEKVSPLYFLSETEDFLADDDSVNVHTFSVLRRSVFSYNFIHEVPEGTEGWEISLYAEYFINGDGGETAYRLIDTRKTTSLTSDASPELGLAPGEYRLVVKKGSSFDGSPYKIEASLEGTTAYEIECNDNIYRYTEIYSGVSVKGSASSFPDRQDEDYYLLRMYNDGFVDLKFEHSTVKDKVSVCWQVLLFSEDGTCMFSVNSLFTDEVNKSGKIGLTKGNYYVLVRNRVYADMTYTLTLTRTDNTDYENEKNDSFDTADAIGIGSTVTGSIASQINGIDRDYFCFSVERNGFCVIDFAHEPIEEADDKNGWNIVLLDDSGNELYKGISAWADDVTVSSPVGLGKGTYYIRIDSENLYLNSERYYITVSFTEDAFWETEFNNTPEAADALTEFIPVTGIISERDTDYDIDCYSLELTEESDITLSFIHEILPENKEIFNFTLYDFNNQPVKCFSSEGEGDAVIKSFSDTDKTQAVYKNLPSGRYYVKVTSGIFFADVQYSLSYTKGE